MKRLIVPLLGVSLLLGTGAALADPPHHDDRGPAHRHDDRHDDRHHDNGRHNGPPPHAWARGERLPHDHRGVYVSDYRKHGLKAPPRGHEWRRVDDRYVLIAVATGLITSVILASH